MGIATAVVAPTSRGSVTLNSSDPLTLPVVDPALLQSDFDQAVMVDAIRSAIQFLTAPSFQGYIVGPVGGLENATTDDELRAYAMAGAVSLDHPVGTASMSPKNATYGVVDPDLVLKKVSGVRIVDASIFVSIFRYVPG
jgi:choline dehydrogenase-like flavoprotein